jgi:hypothetical protein
MSDIECKGECCGTPGEHMFDCPTRIRAEVAKLNAEIEQLKARIAALDRVAAIGREVREMWARGELSPDQAKHLGFPNREWGAWMRPEKKEE